MEHFKLIVNQEKKRFELEVEGYVVFVEYILSNDNVMFLTHTEVPKELGGRGIGSIIVEKILYYIKDHNYKLVPICPFVDKFLVKSPEWQNILAK